MKDNTVRIGYVPIMRDSFPPAPAKRLRDAIRARVSALTAAMPDTELVDDGGLLPDGMLWDLSDIPPLADRLRAQHVDALFLPHCNFGQEEAAAKLASEIGKPVLLWGPRDPAPEGEAFRPLDVQCGLFATSKALQRYGVPFTYLENCFLDSPVLDRGFDRFVRVAAVVKAARGMRVGQIGLRPRQFLSVKVNEDELLRKFGIEVTPIWTDEITSAVEKLRTGNTKYIGAVKKMELPMAAKLAGLQLDESGAPDPAIAARAADIARKVDCTGTAPETLEKMAVVELAIEALAELQNLDAVAFDCWTYLADNFGISACFILGDLIDRGLVAACETDIHAAITARLLQAAARGASCPFIADMTQRHPTNDNGELLWHCGPFAASLMKEGVKGRLCGGKGFYEIRGGDLTVARFEQADGRYLLFADQVRGIDGPHTNGNYVWVETSDWPAWEKKFMYGPYIHHIVGIHGQYADVLKEACRYLGDIEHDSVNTVPAL